MSSMVSSYLSLSSQLAGPFVERDAGLGDLSDMQWRVIYLLRGIYRKHGRAENARQIIKQLESDFAEEGGRKFLYQVFPNVPVSQGSRRAGIPAPPYVADASFGSVA